MTCMARHSASAKHKAAKTLGHYGGLAKARNHRKHVKAGKKASRKRSRKTTRKTRRSKR